mmetsp:Transcript_5679/g.13751  ORF Transcript_5679/g.13751 Transcript_5679/m.13751 type:complete len:961 (+) Transcript_5679:230-3112(+)
MVKHNDANGAGAASGARATDTTETLNSSIGHGSMNYAEGFDSINAPEGFDYRGGGSNSAFDYSPTHSPRRTKSGASTDPGGGLGGGDAIGDGSKSNVGIELQLLPPDQRPGLPNDLLASFIDPEIEDNTEAAEALRANASIKVGKMGKVARSVNAQTVRKLFKTATLRGHGPKRGKPPRVPPGLAGPAGQHVVGIHYTGEELGGGEMYAVQEGEHETSEQVDEIESGIESDSDDDDEGDNSIIKDDDAHGAVDDKHKLHDIHEGGGYNENDDSELRAKYDHEDTDGLFETDATDSTTKRKSKLDNYTSVMTNEGQRDIPTEVVADTMETGKKLIGSIDPHNMLQVQRWRRKKKGSKKKRNKSYVKGKVIDGRHELYTLSIAVMLGVRTSIARTNTLISSSDGPGRRMLSPNDFMAEEKYEFAPKGSDTTPPHKLSHTFKFKDYAPVAFAYLRRMFGVNEFDFLLSVCGNANFIEFISNAKSGQFFFYSSDGKYMIKTMTNDESKFLRRILPHYFRHCTQNPNTLLTKFLGMYRVKLYHLRRNVKFVIMNSVYYTDKSLQTFYDLKGSEIGRSSKPGEEVLKDNDLRDKLPEEAFSFPPELRTRIRDQVSSDCNFLRKMQIMDYSMLIGVHHVPPKKVDQNSNIAETGFKIKEHRTSWTAANKGHGVSSDNENMGGETSIKSTGDESFSSRGSGMEGALLRSQGDSTRRLIKDIRDSAGNGAPNFEFAGLLEDEDDCSYLEGSEGYAQKYAKKAAAYQQHPKFDDVEMKKEQTIEQIYWPFHRFFDINGYRRMNPKECYRCNSYPCQCDGVADLIKAWGIPDFEPPLSDRKDGGLKMDTSGLSHPMVFHGPQGDMLYETKIYYMGIIDILQQYNARKLIETTYRKVEVRGQAEPSCVSPDDYAGRFVKFFEEYAQTAHMKALEESSRADTNSRHEQPKSEPLMPSSKNSSGRVEEMYSSMA